MDLLQRWKLGLEHKDARKFLRGLSETSSGTKHANLLLKDLAIIEESIIHINGLNETMTDFLSEQYDQHLLSIKKAKHIHRNLKFKPSLESRDLLGQLKQVQSLFSNCHFINRTDSLASHQTYPQGVMVAVSLVYHFYSQYVEAPKLITSFQEKDNNLSLIVDVLSDVGTEEVRDKKEELIHDIEVLTMIDTKINLSLSPSFSGLPIVVSWTHHEQQQASMGNQSFSASRSARSEPPQV